MVSKKLAIAIHSVQILVSGSTCYHFITFRFVLMLSFIILFRNENALRRVGLGGEAPTRRLSGDK